MEVLRATFGRLSAPSGFLGLLVLVVAVGTVGCSGGDQELLLGTGTSTITTHITDPPVCRAPLGNFNHVWVTITKVRAHQSSTSGASDAGWTDLVDLTSNPRQIDLLGNPSATTGLCVLATLGQTTGLPAGQYQQIRLILLANSAPPSGTTPPSPNNCSTVGPNVFNCVELIDTSRRELLLSSEAQTGIKIPPGQIAGGGLNLEAGQTADIVLDFDTCRSLVPQPSGNFRLKPTLRASEVSITSDTISGSVVVSGGTNLLPAPATIIVLAELRDPSDNTLNQVIASATADSTTGNFSLCPLPMLPTGATGFDIVAAAVDNNGVTYNATVIPNVAPGTASLSVPLVPEATTPPASPARIEGTVTTAPNTAAAIDLVPVQEVTLAGTTVKVPVPVFPVVGGVSSTPSVITESGSCPAGTKCKNYTLFVPTSNPQLCASGGNCTPPASGAINYRISATATVPSGTNQGDADCVPSRQTTATFAIIAGGMVTAPTVDFTGCQSGF